IYVTEVVVESFQLLESKEVSQQRGVNASNSTPIGQQASNAQRPFPYLEGSFIDISDDDLPF
ncbi:MAG: Single-stranded DNA-binding protein, partial [Enterococcus faecalis DORA_14]